MEKLAKFIVKKRNIIGVLFIVFTLFCVYLDNFVVLNYDFSKYIPNTEDSIKAYNKVEEEFGMNGTGRIMFNNVTLAEAAKYKSIIENVEGVDMVMWLDDYADVYSSPDFIDKELMNTYYKDNKAVMDIMFEEDDYSQKTYNAVHKLYEVLPNDDSVCYVGSAITTSSIRDNVKREMIIILAVIIPIIIVILLLTTDSWFSPVLFLSVIGISVLMNKGTNIIFDSISYVTYSITAALQLAISMDYSVFLLHQFSRERKNGLSPENAMIATLKEGITPILASALTTIAGFVALSFMNFGLGKDLGLVFSKGIVLSLLCVVFLMPCLILMFYGIIEKTSHKSLLPDFNGFSKIIMKLTAPILAIAIIIVIPTYVAQNSNNFLYGSAAIGAGKGTEVYEDEQEVTKYFGRNQFMLMLIPNTGYVDANSLCIDLESIKATSEDGKEVKVLRYVKTIANTLPVGVPDFFAPQDTLKKFKNDSYTKVLMSLRCDSESELAYNTLNEIKQIAEKYYADDYYLTGTIAVTKDMQNVIEADYSRVNMVSILAVMIILLFTFRSVALPILLVGVIEEAIFINMGIPYLMGEPLIFVGYLIVSTIQLGATIDYAILLTNNYMEYKETMNKKEAIIEALKKSLGSLITSGGILITCGYAIKMVSSITAVSNMGELIGRGSLFSVILVTFLLPQVLYVFDGLIQKTTLQNEYKLSIGKKIYAVGRKTVSKSKKAQALKEMNKKLIDKISKRIKYKYEKVQLARSQNKSNKIKKLDKLIKDLEILKGNLEKENDEVENTENKIL